MEVAFEHQYSQQLGLNNNHYPAELAFNFYVNEKITDFLGRPVDIESARENFYLELIQHTNLPKNHSFAPIIREINQEIERYTQRTFPITYQDKGKGKLQTPVVTSKEIQIPNWKKQRIESLIYPSYHYMPGSIINIAPADAFISTKTPLARIMFQIPPQQPLSLQQLQQQPPQPLNLDPMAYTPIAKLDNFTGKEDDTQVCLNDIEKAITANGWNDARAMQAILYFLKDTANSWYQSLINKPQDFDAFKVKFLRYFSNNNTIDANYFTVPQILNQFICGLRSSILQHVCLLHSGTLQDAVTCARDFESTGSEINHAQAINLVMNRSSELDSKLENLYNDATIKETLLMAKINHIHLYQPINSGNKKRISATIVVNKDIFKSTATTINLSTTSISSANLSINGPNLSATTTGNISTTTTNNLSTPNDSDFITKLTSQRSPKTKNHAAKLEIIDGSSSANSQPLQLNRILSMKFGHQESPKPKFPELFNNQKPTQKQQTCTSNILPATVTNNELLNAIFPFELEESSNMPLFSGAALEEKPITAMYTDVKIDGHHIKLILDSAASARIIMADRVTKTPISKIHDLPIKINSIIVLIKVFVMEATQYQALVGNDWLSKINTTLDWNTQELQLIPAMCGHFKATNTTASLINFEEKKPKPTWEAYQVLWADKEHNKLPPILSWNNNGKEKQTNELTWETDDLTWTDNEQEEASSWEWNKNKGKGKKKKEETPPTTTIYNSYTHHTPQQSNYRWPRLVCIDCGKKLSSMDACCGDNKEYHTATKFYCYPCLLEHFGQPKRQGKWDIQPCLACEKTLLDEGMWNNIPGRGETCNVFCQYIILISNRMATTKIEGMLPKEIRTIKNNPPEPIELDWDAEPVINFLEPEEFYEHYQNLAPTRKKQKQQLTQMMSPLFNSQ
ncbi:hypothetical protein G9A89_011000 [Geosiphon pyriformis]|nr:hypothetical protein G9A89_011000 [Geosiphon pyriformis]